MTREKLKKWGGRLITVFGITIALSPALLVVAWIVAVSYEDSNPEHGHQLASVPWLPVEASEISYVKGYIFRAYEFSISEDGFHSWLEETNRKPSEIVEPIGIGTIHGYKDCYQDLEVRFPNGEDYIKVSEGLYWRTPPRGNGGGTYIAFDRENGRAYFYSTPR